MSRRDDLDVFAAYTGVRFTGNRARVLAQALADPRTRDLVWLYLAVNEIAWCRISMPRALAARYRRAGEKACRLAAGWRMTTGYWLGRPFRVWYAPRSGGLGPGVSRAEEQRWRESIWLGTKQLTRSSTPSGRPPNGRPTSSCLAPA